MIDIRPYKYKFIDEVGVNSKYVLEVGIGNDSPKRFFMYNSNCVYHGIDKDLDYNLSLESISLINKYFKIDLEVDNLDLVPNNFYDYIILSHVIEHIYNGEDVIKELTNKIKSGGVIYLEYPSKKSVKFPSMKGTLNFFDDKTHIRFYNIKILESILVKNSMIIIKSGVKRDILRIIGIPFMIIKSIILLRYIRGSIFWDLCGFAEYIVAKKS